MYHAALEGQDAPPVDIRYLSKPLARSDSAASETRADVISFLQGLYDSLAETLPDSKDTTFDDVDETMVSREALADQYSIEFNKQAAAHDHGISIPAGRPKEKQKKPRTVLRGVKLNLDRVGGDEPGNREIRWLPPGTMKEIWSQYKSASALEKPAVFPTFWKETRFARL